MYIRFLDHYLFIIFSKNMQSAGSLMAEDKNNRAIMRWKNIRNSYSDSYSRQR